MKKKLTFKKYKEIVFFPGKIYMIITVGLHTLPFLACLEDYGNA